VLSVIAICLATFLGFFIALARLSDNLLLRKFGGFYVEMFRNIPLLLQLFFWYFAALKLLPPKRESVNFFDVAFLNIEGFVIPIPVLEESADSIVWAIVISFALAFGIWRWAKNRQINTGQPFPSFFVGLGLVIFVPFIVAWIKDFPISWEIPKFGRFNYEGGIALQPEFTAMLFGLTLYNGAFIGEIIRAGILSVHKGQREAANSIGFKQMQIYSQIIVPQAMRLIIPPLTNQYLNLTKSTALAAALCEVTETDADATRVAFAAHRQFQRGLGSGVDVACSSAGGLIEYRMRETSSVGLDWPIGLAYALFWSGVAVGTSAKIERLDSQMPKPSRAALVYAARRMATAWRSGSAVTILDEYRDYTQVLREFSTDHSLGIFDAGHAELAESAEAAGLVYKPCGAGGGDVGIVFADNEESITSFVEQQLPQQFQTMNARLDPLGVQVERKEQ
jgi:ABC-type amino acid transport system permease subunit